MEPAIERLAALAFIVTGLSHLLAPRAWVRFFERVAAQGEAAGIYNGLLHLPLGLVIAAFHPVWQGPGLVVTLIVACAPTTVATERLLWTIWSDRRYAHLQLGPDRVPEMSKLLDVTGPRPTILSYEDWSPLIWYETGASVVSVLPPGYAKLAFDPEVFTGHGQAERQPERPRGRVHPGGLADPLLLDGGQRVVVELGHQQAQPGPRQQQGPDQPPAEVRSGD